MKRKKIENRIPLNYQSLISLSFLHRTDYNAKVLLRKIVSRKEEIKTTKRKKERKH